MDWKKQIGEIFNNHDDTNAFIAAAAARPLHLNFEKEASDREDSFSEKRTFHDSPSNFGA